MVKNNLQKDGLLKNKLIITISDINGSKQYTFNQFIKIAIHWIIIAIIITLIIGSMIINYLLNNIDKLKYKKEILEKEKKELKLAIKSKTQTLEAMNEQLIEVEKLLGVRNEAKENIKQTDLINSSIDNNATNTHKNKQILKDLEFKLLSRMIPNGKPLEYKRVSTKFGFRIHPITKRKQFHSAVDLTAPLGTPIYTPADGVVVYAGKKNFYGTFILINHGFGFSTAYGHMNKIFVKSGDYVLKGEKIAECGNKGRSTGSHLHYEIRYLTKWLDPEPFMKNWSKNSYEKVISKNRIVKWKELVKNLDEKIKIVKKIKQINMKGDR